MWAAVVARFGIIVPLVLALVIGLAFDVVERIRGTIEAFMNNNGHEGVRITCAEQERIDARRASKYWSALRALTAQIPYVEVDDCDEAPPHIHAAPGDG